jgi:Kre9/KNH-like N-terminal Ig-like domain
VSPTITNATACNQFSDVNRMPSQLSTITVNGVKYTTGSTGSAAAGSESGDSYFHTYQNGFCYEFLLEVNTFNRGALDNPSSVQEFNDTANLQNYFLSSVSFSAPTAKPPISGNSTPAVASFTESSQVAYSGTPNSGITFSWTTQGVDYVQLSYSCASGLLIVNGANPQCQGLVDPPSSPNYSPNGSTTIVFGNENRSSPVQSSIPVTITLVPFVNGMVASNLEKTVNLTVTPENAFPNGVPATNNKLNLNINGSNFKQGSSMNIAWTDSNDTNANDPTPPDSCVDLYLVQDNANGGETYLYQIVSSCVQPAMSGSYSWTVPSNYSGSGFHILGITPGLTANALSAPFTISAQ